MFPSRPHPVPLFTRSLLWLGASALVAGVSFVVAAENQTATTGDTQTTAVDPSAETSQPDKRERLREGTKIVDQLGYFKTTGDRATFVTEDGDKFGGLENLNLERIFRILRENPDQLTWSISGTITEFRGANFLQIHRAVLKTRNIRRSGNRRPGESSGDGTLPRRAPGSGS